MPTQNQLQINDREKYEALATWQGIIEQYFPAVVEKKMPFEEFAAAAEVLSMAEIVSLANYIGDPDNYGSGSAVTDEMREKWLGRLNELVMKKDTQLRRRGNAATAGTTEGGPNAKFAGQYDEYSRGDLAARRRAQREPNAGDQVGGPVTAVETSPNLVEDGLSDLTEKLGGGKAGAKESDSESRIQDLGQGEKPADSRIPVATFDAGGNEIETSEPIQDKDKADSPFNDLIAASVEPQGEADGAVSGKIDEIKDINGNKLSLPDAESVEFGSLLPSERDAEPKAQNPEPGRNDSKSPAEVLESKPQEPRIAESFGIKPPPNEDRNKGGNWQRIKNFMRLGGSVDAAAAHQLEINLNRGAATSPIPANSLESIAASSPVGHDEQLQQAV